jgi:hypothetical protein
MSALLVSLACPLYEYYQYTSVQLSNATRQAAAIFRFFPKRKNPAGITGGVYSFSVFDQGDQPMITMLFSSSTGDIIPRS